MKWFDWLKGKAKADGVDIEDVPQSFAEGNPQSAIPNPQLIKSLVDAEVSKVVAAKTSEFAESQRALDAEKARLKAEGEKLEKAKADSRKAEISSFCEGLCKEGKITPAMTKYGMGMTNFLEAISGIEASVEFSEGAEKKKQTPFEYAKGFLACFKKQIEFGEFAGNEKDFKAGGNAGEKLSALTKKKMDDNKNLGYAQAFSEVQRENMQLAQEYAVEIAR